MERFLFLLGVTMDEVKTMQLPYIVEERKGEVGKKTQKQRREIEHVENISLKLGDRFNLKGLFN